MIRDLLNVGLVAAGLLVVAMPAEAQTDTKRQEAGMMCLDKAHREVPSFEKGHEKDRWYIYEACMNEAGFKP